MNKKLKALMDRAGIKPDQNTYEADAVLTVRITRRLQAEDKFPLPARIKIHDAMLAQPDIKELLGNFDVDSRSISVQVENFRRVE